MGLNWYKRKEMRLILLLFFLIAALIVGTGVSDIYQMRTMQEITDDLYEHPFQVSNAAQRVKLEILRMHRDMKDVVLSRSAEDVDRLIASVDRYEKRVYGDLGLINDKILGKEGLVLRTQTAELFAQWRPIREDVIALMREGRVDEAAAITRGKGAEHVEALEASADRLYRYARSKADDFVTASKRLHEEQWRTDLGMRTLLLLLLGAIAYVTVRKISLYLARQEHLAGVVSVIRDVNQLIVREKEPQALIQKSCDILGNGHIYGNAWILLTDAEGCITHAAASDHSDRFAAFKERVETGWKPQCIARILENGIDFYAIDDTGNSCDECPLKEQYVTKGAFSIQLRHGDAVYGYLTLSVEQKYLEDPDELALLEEVGGDISYALHNIGREARIVQSEERFRSLFENLYSGVAIYVQCYAGRRR